MNSDQAIEFGQEAVLTSLTLAAPFLIVAIATAILLGIVQAMTHIQDQTVSFVPKVILLGITAVFCLSWCGEQLVDYSKELYSKPRFMHLKPADSNKLPESDMVASTRSK